MDDCQLVTNEFRSFHKASESLLSPQKKGLYNSVTSGAATLQVTIDPSKVAPGASERDPASSLAQASVAISRLERGPNMQNFESKKVINDFHQLVPQSATPHGNPLLSS